MVRITHLKRMAKWVTHLTINKKEMNFTLLMNLEIIYIVVQKKMEVYIHHYGFRTILEIGNIIVRMDIEQ